MGGDGIPEIDKPWFLDQDKAETAPYVGAAEASEEVVPTFDEELEPKVEVETEVELPPDTPDQALPPSDGYKERWRTMARLHAMGFTNNQIAVKLQYTPSRVSIALKHPWVKEQIYKYRRMLEVDITSKIKLAAEDGIERIHRIILDDKEKTTTVLEASKWVLEKHTGKATQSVNVESSTLENFMNLVKDMKDRGEAIDITPNSEINTESKLLNPSTQDQEPEKQDKWDNWIELNL